MHWGFYCRTCGKSSPRWYAAPQDLLQDFSATHPEIQRLAWDEEGDTLPTVKILIIVWLASHLGHDLWAECETGVLLLESGRKPAGSTDLPTFVRHGRQ